MIDAISRVPGWVIALCVASPFLAIAIGMILCAVAYVLTLKAYMALEDNRRTRKRRP